MAAKLTRLTQQSSDRAAPSGSCSSRSRRPVRKLLDTPSSDAIHPLPQYAFIAWCSAKARRQLYLYLVYGGEWSASRLGRFTPTERAPDTHWVGGWVGPRAGLDIFPTPAEIRTLEHPAGSPAPHH
jgi:hypothetical protein